MSKCECEHWQVCGICAPPANQEGGDEPRHIYRPLTANDAPVDRKHSHYFKPCPFDHVDIYRVLVLFNVTDPCLQHAVKKIMVAGGRGGGKDISKDVQEAIDTLARWQEMRKEEGSAPIAENLSDC